MVYNIKMRAKTAGPNSHVKFIAHDRMECLEQYLAMENEPIVILGPSKVLGYCIGIKLCNFRNYFIFKQ